MISIEFYFGAFIAWYQQNIVTSKITRHVDSSTRPPTYYCKETKFGVCSFYQSLNVYEACIIDENVQKNLKIGFH